MNEEDLSSSEPLHVIELTTPLSDGCIPLRSIEIIQFLNEEGQEGVAVRWQGTGNIVAELGMIEYAKQVLVDDRFYSQCSSDEEKDSDDQ